MNNDILRQARDLIESDQKELGLIKKSIDYIEKQTRQYGGDINTLIERTANIKIAIDALLKQNKESGTCSPCVSPDSDNTAENDND